MAGGLFAVNRKWFWDLGGYDPGLEIWGGEQYEISFKVSIYGTHFFSIIMTYVLKSKLKMQHNKFCYTFFLLFLKKFKRSQEDMDLNGILGRTYLSLFLLTIFFLLCVLPIMI